MKSSNVVGAVSKPTPEEKIRLYETFDDGQSPEIRRQLREGLLHTGMCKRSFNTSRLFPKPLIPKLFLGWVSILWCLTLTRKRTCSNSTGPNRTQDSGMFQW